ncbi:MAG: hypothetical protein HXX81_00440 [Campylobacterales bacterium]|nr:hypothetical protein [Campylobacterales bacterium]
MQTIEIQVKDMYVNNIMQILNSLKDVLIDDIRVECSDDVCDLKLLKKTRDEESISFDEYLKN